MSIAHLTSNLGLLAFALSSLVYLLTVQKNRTLPWTGTLAFSLFVVGTAMVSVALGSVVGTASLVDVSGILLTCALGWLTILGHLQFQLRLIGAFVAPIATLMLLVQFFLAPVRLAEATTMTDSFLIKAHVAMAIIGQAFAIIACAVSVLYLWQQNLLKKKLLDQLPLTIPAIDRLDMLLTGSLWAGFVFITFGLLSGALFAQMAIAPAQGLDFNIKVIWAILVWAWYLATLLARNVFNRPSKRIAQMALGGFLLLAMTYFGMGIFRPMGGI